MPEPGWGWDIPSRHERHQLKVWAGSAAFSSDPMAQGIYFDIDNQMCIRVCSGLGLHALQWATGLVHSSSAQYGDQKPNGGECKNEVAVCLMMLALIPLLPTDANDADFQGVETRWKMSSNTLLRLPCSPADLHNPVTEMAHPRLRDGSSCETVGLSHASAPQAYACPSMGGPGWEVGGGERQQKEKGALALRTGPPLSPVGMPMLYHRG